MSKEMAALLGMIYLHEIAQIVSICKGVYPGSDPGALRRGCNGV